MHQDYVSDVLFSGESHARCKIRQVISMHDWPAQTVRQLSAWLAQHLTQISRVNADFTTPKDLTVWCNDLYDFNSSRLPVDISHTYLQHGVSVLRHYIRSTNNEA